MKLVNKITLLGGVIIVAAVSVVGPGALIYVMTEFSGCCDDPVVRRIEAGSYDELVRQGIDRSLERVIPTSASGIKIEYNPGDLMGGASLRFRCYVERSSMEQYVLKWEGAWQLDSTMVNDSHNFSFAVMEPPRWGGDFWRNEHFPEKGAYWSYNKIYKNNGGVRCYYDVVRSLFYYESSSN